MLNGAMSEKKFATPPVPDTKNGTTVFEPDGRGPGNWVGAPKVVFDRKTDKFYMYHRVRKPLGKGRGVKARIAESSDGKDFEVITEGTKEQLNADSLEAGSIIRDPATGKWRLYISYQPTGHNSWRVGMIESDSPEEFDFWEHRTVMLPDDYGLYSLKDPSVFIVGGQYYAYVSVDQEGDYEVVEQNGKEVRRPLGFDSSGLLTSPDGKYWRDFRYVLESGGGAQGERGHYKARLNSVVWLPPLFVGFFDGGDTFYDNFEEWAGIATSHDLENWKRVSRNGPWVESPYGSVRYMDGLIHENKIYYYYEYTRKDGSHEIRVNSMELD
uniref:Uncharacterized protein n=1 Tax=uncultured organism TaxID=155900 RepID=M1PUX5_9ZZZZ|nr:hypothetical protein FLSS-5_0005 [uncultured organism]